ncbi:MAG: hypothetical protein P4M13_01420 [Alphaproteobacteria bacterium]|nr:hypothetical protein [Alphaproteobacteria bacterium]
MLKFSTNQSHVTPIALSPDEDRKLRLAFGRFAEGRHRSDGEDVVSKHYELKHRFLFDCRPDAPHAPLLFLVAGTHIRREVDGRGTPHDEGCDFFREPQEQKKLIVSYRRQKPEDEHQLNLLRNFRDDDTPPRLTAHVTTNRSRPKLARVLCSLLHEAKLDRLYPTEPLRGNREKQILHLEDAAASYSLSSDQKLSRWLATSLGDYYSLKKRLDEKPENLKRPHGLFIETFDRIENNTLYPKRADLKPISVTGKLAVFGEGETTRRPPYLVIGLLSQPRRNAAHVELLNAYAHPCLAWDRLTLVDSQLERETLAILIACRDELAKKSNITMTIEKPLFDIGPRETEDPRELCLPDFILRCRGEGVSQPLVVIETMGYDDPAYRERKQRMRALFERIGRGDHPVPVIEYDRFKSGKTAAEIDRHFLQTIRGTIAK